VSGRCSVGSLSLGVGRPAAERIGGRPSLVLERPSGVPIDAIASVSQPGVVAELAERLAVKASLATPLSGARVSRASV
jgi:hypothetical protein